VALAVRAHRLTLLETGSLWEGQALLLQVASSEFRTVQGPVHLSRSLPPDPTWVRLRLPDRLTNLLT